MMPKLKPTMVPFDGSRIPQALKALPRWTPWKAVWNEKRGKFDKIPFSARQPQYGISTANPDKWSDWARASACLEANPGVFQGLGLCLTGITGFVGIDIDGCIKDGVLAPWALDIIRDADSYTEVSPSGNGLRIFVLGEQANDWNNHEVGIEVYGGNDARFLTVTGHHMVGTPTDVRAAPPTTLAALESRYAKVRSKATVIDLRMPTVLDALALPDLDDLELTPATRNFLESGLSEGDRSTPLHAAGIELCALGLTDDVVFSILANNEHAMDVALSHRRLDPERALMYLWREQTLKARPKAASRVAPLSDFEDISTPEERAEKLEAEPVPDTPAKNKYEFVQMSEFRKGKKTPWLIKGVFPNAEVGAFFGESGSGKSFIVLDMVLAIARGVEWNGNRVTQGNVAYVVAEGGGGFSNRIAAYDAHNGTQIGGGGMPAFVALDGAPNITDPAEVKLMLVALSRHKNLKVVVLDTLAQVTPGANENSGEDMGRALAAAKRIHKRTGATVLIVAHAGKDATRGMRGWSGIKAAMDFEILIERSGDYRAATITKMKDGGGEGAEYPFKLNVIALGVDDDGDAVSSCTVAFGNLPVKPTKESAAGKHQKVILAALNGLMVAGAPTRDELLADAVRNIDPKVNPEKRRDRAREALNDLLKAGKLIEVGGLISTAP
jgi:hypothetical protein